MKRSNAIILGTILVILIGVVLFMQAGTDPFAGQQAEEALHGETPTRDAVGNEAGRLDPNKLPNQTGTTVSADDLATTITDPQQATEQKTVPAMPYREKFEGVNSQSAEPTSRWYDPNRKAGNEQKDKK
ncbi:MAG: hypothetical protein KatS3mg015_1348 [Fimbriimonadales bacterium]|nr:MAG: hypothetical protein KatS3mg015_1348 [Fimbriimonadales bacterium]